MDSCTSKSGSGVQGSPEIIRKTDKDKMPTSHWYCSAEMRSKDTPLVYLRNFFPEIITCDMFEVQYD